MPTPEKGEYWGILGGAFDPVHRGHITLACDIRSAKQLTGVMLVPSGNHPFKKNGAVAGFEQRIDMLRLACADYDFLMISQLEDERELSGYTIDTVRALKELYPDATFCFLIGADNIGQILSWYHPEEIFNEIPVIAGTRPGFSVQPTSDPILSQIEYVETSSIDVSSSEIRDAIRKNDLSKLDQWLDPKVRDYILERNLYR